MQQTAISWEQWTYFVLNVFISQQVSHSYNVWQKIALIFVFYRKFDFERE